MERKPKSYSRIELAAAIVLAFIYGAGLTAIWVIDRLKGLEAV